LAEAKATAVRRRTTLKAVIEHALKREIRSDARLSSVDSHFNIDGHGLPVLKKTGSTKVTSEMVYEMLEDLGI
jgi:hypothetical protein